MGNCFSDPSSKKGKGQVLGSGPAPNKSTNTNQSTGGSIAGKKPTNYQSTQPSTLGGSAGEQGSERERALQAAEERARAVSRSQFGRSRSCIPLLVGLLHSGR
jgi:hypothetical protein